MNIDQMSEYVTIQEVADHFSVSRYTIQRAIDVGRLPAVRVGNRAAYRISRAAVEAFAARNSTVSPADDG